jgi:1,2-diacylglycerol 3-alpha-glucosyltransferase
MRILIAATSNYIAFHGQAIFTINLAEGLVKKGHVVQVLVASEKGRAYRSQRNGVQMESLPALNLKAFHPDVFLPLFSAPSVLRILQTFQPDILHIQDHYPVCRNAILSARCLGIKTVGTNHFMPENLAPYVRFISNIKPVFNWVLWRWMRETYDRVDAVVAPSQTAAAILQKVGLRPPVSPISCGVDISLFHTNTSVDRSAWRARYGIDPNKIIFFFVGRVDREKHLDVLLRALQTLKRDDIQLVIAGKGAWKKHLIALTEQLGLGKKVHFAGFLPQEDLPSVLNSIDIFAMPSEAELLSISTLEAMGCSRPVLAANAVALPELVTDSVNGLLFKPGDVADAARCMAWFADHPERWSAMGAASLEKVQMHSLENIVRKYEALYERILNGVHLDQAE